MHRYIIVPVQWPPVPRSFTEELRLISSQLVSGLVDSNLGQASRGEGNGWLLDDDLEGLRNVLDNAVYERGARCF